MFEIVVIQKKKVCSNFLRQYFFINELKMMNLTFKMLKQNSKRFIH